MSKFNGMNDPKRFEDGCATPEEAEVPMTLDEWIESNKAVSFLKQNLQANMDALTDLTDTEKKDLLRANLIMIRQCICNLYMD